MSIRWTSRFAAWFVLGTTVAALAGCDEEEQRQPVDRGVPLDPTCDWQPSSEWAAEGDLEDPGDPEDPWTPGADAAGRSDAGGEAWYGADADADGDGDADGDADAEPEPDVDEGDGGSACDPDAEDGGGCDATEEPGDADPCDPDAPGDGVGGGDGCDGSKSGDAGEEEGTPSWDPDVPYVMYLSADDSNSQASPVIARWFINRGQVVPWNVVRIWEFLNYYDIGYEPAPEGRVRVVSQFRPVKPADGLYALQVGVQSHVVPPAERRRMNLTLVLDTSGSMAGTPIDLERSVVAAIADSLRDGDVVSAVEWDTSRSVRLDSHDVTGPGDRVILAMAESLVEGGGTDLHAGLEMGYRLARDNYRPGWLNRVVLISDGQANVGITDVDIIAAGADEMEGEGIYLVGVGCGEGYNDMLMDEVTDAGRGAYVFVDGRDEARRMFVDRFLQTMEVAVRDVRVQLTLPGVFRIEEFHGEEYSADPLEVEPQHLAPGDAMVFHQILRAADPREVYSGDRISVRVDYRDQSGARAAVARADDALVELIAAPVPEMRKADAVVVYAQALIKVAHLMDRGLGENARQICEAARSVIDDSAAALDDDELRGIVALLDRYCPMLHP